MNVIDIIIIAIIGLCVLFGLYRGFIQSVLNLAGGLASFVGSFWLFPKLSDVLSANTGLTRMISTYTDSQSLLGDLDLSNLAVNTLSEANIAAIDYDPSTSPVNQHNRIKLMLANMESDTDAENAVNETADLLNV